MNHSRDHSNQAATQQQEQCVVHDETLQKLFHECNQFCFAQTLEWPRRWTHPFCRQTCGELGFAQFRYAFDAVLFAQPLERGDRLLLKRAADQQGFDRRWLGKHLLLARGWVTRMPFSS